MPFPHPFITVDQNQLRHPDRIADVLNDCCRNGLHILLPDGAFLEFAKSGCFVDTTRRSLMLLAPYRELVVASRKINHLIADELQQRAPATALIHDGTTAFLRSILEELDRSEETALRRLEDGPVAELMPAALEVWNDHERNKHLVQGFHDALKAGLSPDELKALRRSPEEEIANWLSSTDATNVLIQWLKKRGADITTAYQLTRTPSVTAGFLSSLAGLAIYWIAHGGIESAAGLKFSGDLNDVEYVILGALSRSLATEDHCAGIVCNAVAQAFVARRSLP